MLPGVNEAILTVVIIALLFGATRVPKAVKYTGKTLYEYKKGKDEGEEGLRQVEHRIKEIEKQNARENNPDILTSLKSNLNNAVEKTRKKEYVTLGAAMVAAGALLLVGGQIWELGGEITVGVAILLVASGIVLIAIQNVRS